MDLTERGRGNRHRIERGEDLIQPHTELRFNELADTLKLHGRYLVLKGGEFVRDLVGQNVHARGHELSHLDHQPAKIAREATEGPGDPDEAGRSAARG